MQKYTTVTPPLSGPSGLGTRRFMSSGGVPGGMQQQTPPKRDSSPFLRPHALPSQRSLPIGNSSSTLTEEAHTHQKHAAAAVSKKGLQSGSEVFLPDSRKNSFSTLDEGTLERKGSADSQGSLFADRPLSTNDGAIHIQTDQAPEHKALIRTASDKTTGSGYGTSISSSLPRGSSRLAAEVKAPGWLAPLQANTPSLQTDYPDKHTTGSATHGHDEHEQDQVMDSLQHLHLKLDTMAKHFGISAPGHKNVPSLISAHRDSNHGASQGAEHHQQMDSLISQVEATLQHPAPKVPAAATAASRSESSSIGAEVRKQLDLVGEQLGSKAYAGPHSEASHLAAQVSQLSNQLHAAQTAAAAAQQEVHHLHSKQQEVGGLRGQLLAAESTAADAVKEAGQLRQQLRSAQFRSQNPTAAPDVAELHRQTSSVFDQVMKETFEALKDEFQPSVVYKGVEVEHVIKSVMRKQAMAAQQAAQELASQQLARVAAS